MPSYEEAGTTGLVIQGVKRGFRMKQYLKLFGAQFLFFGLLLILPGTVALRLTMHVPSVSNLNANRTQPSTLSSVKVLFHTTDDDKDKDTTVSVFINLPTGELVAKIENIRGEFKNQSDKNFDLAIVKTIAEQQIQGCTTTIRTAKSEGHDIWKFDFKVEIKFKDRPVIPIEVQGITLKENDIIDFPL